MDLACDAGALRQRGGALGLLPGPLRLGQQRLGLLGLGPIRAPVASEDRQHGQQRRVPQHRPQIGVLVADGADLDREDAGQEHHQQAPEGELETGREHAHDRQGEHAGVVVGGGGKTADRGQQSQRCQQQTLRPGRLQPFGEPPRRERRGGQSHLGDRGGAVAV